MEWECEMSEMEALRAQWFAARKYIYTTVDTEQHVGLLGTFPKLLWMISLESADNLVRNENAGANRHGSSPNEYTAIHFKLKPA